MPLASARSFILFTFVALGMLMSTPADAKARLLTTSDGVVAFSGPGEFYRPLLVYPAKSEIPASQRLVQTKSGAFYKVLVKLSEKKSVIGYISVQANARLIDDKLDEDDLSKYGDVALVSRALQVSFSNFRDQASLAAIGYMTYLSPGFYVKGFGGRFADATSSAIAAGGEVGNDAILLGKISGLVSYDLGLFVPSHAGAVFDGSSNLNAMMQAAVGLRYNLSGIASMSAAATQAVFFNANNSFVTSGLNVTLEIGL